MPGPIGFLTSQAPSYNARSTTAIVTGQSVAGWARLAITTIPTLVNSVVSGSMTAGVLATVFQQRNTAGQMSHLTLRSNTTGARTLRVKITIDGVYTAYDFTSASSSAADVGAILAGVSSPTSTFVIPPIKWNSSILIEWALNTTEAGVLTAEYIYSNEY